MLLPPEHEHCCANFTPIKLSKTFTSFFSFSYPKLSIIKSVLVHFFLSFLLKIVNFRSLISSFLLCHLPTVLLLLITTNLSFFTSVENKFRHPELAVTAHISAGSAYPLILLWFSSSCWGTLPFRRTELSLSFPQELLHQFSALFPLLKELPAPIMVPRYLKKSSPFLFSWQNYRSIVNFVYT